MLSFEDNEEEEEDSQIKLHPPPSKRPRLGKNPDALEHTVVEKSEEQMLDMKKQLIEEFIALT